MPLIWHILATENTCLQWKLVYPKYPAILCPARFLFFQIFGTLKSFFIWLVDFFHIRKTSLFLDSHFDKSIFFKKKIMTICLQFAFGKKKQFKILFMRKMHSEYIRVSSYQQQCKLPFLVKISNLDHIQQKRLKFSSSKRVDESCIKCGNQHIAQMLCNSLVVLINVGRL